METSSSPVQSAPGVVQAGQRGCLRQGGGAGEQVRKAIEQHQPGEQADGGEADQLDHRFQRDGGDQAAMMLVGIDPRGAEQHGERRQQQRRAQGHAALGSGPAPGASITSRLDDTAFSCSAI